MNFAIPEYKIDEGVWFLDQQERVLYGHIRRFTLAVSKETTNIYYDVELEDESYYVLRESDIIPHNRMLKRPKFEPGDNVAYEVILANKQKEIVSGRINDVQITLYNRQEFEIVYTMEDDPNYWILEDEIIGYAEVKQVAETTEEVEGHGV
jgi:hypothetical protein